MVNNENLNCPFQNGWTMTYSLVNVRPQAQPNGLSRVSRRDSASSQGDCVLLIHTRANMPF